MRVSIDDGRCQGHAMCMLACPSIFELSDEDGHAFVTASDVPTGMEDTVLKAQQSCPEQAILIEH